MQNCCCFSGAKLCPTLCNPKDCSMPDSSLWHYLLEFAQIHFHWVVMLSNCIILCHPLFLSPSIFSSKYQGLFHWVSPLHHVAKVLELQLQRQFFHWKFRVDLGLTALFSSHFKGFSSLLQQHDSKELILWHPALFMVQLSHLYVTTRKTIALIILTFVSKEMSLFFNTLSRIIIAFLPRRKQVSVPNFVSMRTFLIYYLLQVFCFVLLQHLKLDDFNKYFTRNIQ